MSCLKAFGNWCLIRGSYYYDWDISWIASTRIGEVQLGKNIPWAEPVFDAFVHGAWQLFWTEKTLYWTAKPTLSVERIGRTRRLHNEHGPACANDIENLYFWHGVMVPAYAVTFPEWITLDEIKLESNEEVRRILIERFGWEKFLRESGAKHTHRRFNERDRQWEELFKLDDGTRRFVVADPSTGRKFALGVPRDVETCEQAQSFLSHGLDKFAVHRS